MNTGDVRIKICGLTNLEDAVAAADLGADFLGFVFAPSPRRLSLARAREFWRDLPPGVPRVGVFKDQKSREVEAVLEHLPLGYLQFHGRESPAICRSFGLPVIRAVSPGDGKGLSVLELYRDVAEYFLVDLPKKGAARAVLPVETARAAGRLGKPTFLAGGLSPANVGALVEAVNPFGVDVARGVEAEPGRKDRKKMKKFVDEVRRASRPGGDGGKA